MQYSDTSGKQGIIEDITFLTGIGTTEYTVADRTRNVNGYCGKIWAAIFESYGGAKFMDDNTSTASETTTSGSNTVPYVDLDITSGTKNISLPSDTLAITGVQLKNSAGTWDNPLSPITYEEFLAAGGDGSMDSSNGTPTFYIWQGDVIRLIPTPDYTSSASCRVFLDQAFATFATNDTTKVPGFASPFHRMLSIGAALDWCIVRGPADRAANLATLYADYERRLRSFYMKRWRDRQTTGIGALPDLIDEYS